MVIVEMTEKVKLLLSMQEKDGLQWRGTKRDLLELLHEVYYHCGIVMADGSYATFTYLVGRVFKVFGLVLLATLLPRRPCRGQERGSQGEPCQQDGVGGFGRRQGRAGAVLGGDCQITATTVLTIVSIMTLLTKLTVFSALTVRLWA